MVGKTILVKGLKYRYEKTYKSKKAAFNRKRVLQSNGYSVRIKTVADGSALYIRRRF